MENFNWKTKIEFFDSRRDIVIPGNLDETIQYSVQQFLQIGREAIHQRGYFAVALSGGQTPQQIFQQFTLPVNQQALDWSKVYCFWSDERSVPSNDPESNYFSAMQAGLAKLPLKPENIFRMIAEKDIEENALIYEKLIQDKISAQQFDLIMLGMGEDGHTASLFPSTEGLHAQNRLVIANYVPQKQTWRMSMTYECIHLAKTICIYALGKKKAAMVQKILTGPYDPYHFPAQGIGTPTHKALWILDRESSELLLSSIHQS